MNIFPASARCLVFALVPFLCACNTIQKVGGWVGVGDDDGYLTDVPSRLVIETLWSESAGTRSRGDYSALLPLVEDERIYTCDAEGRVTAFAASGGDKIWQKKLDVTASFGVGGGDDLLLIGTVEGEVIALEAETGEEAWRRRLGEEVTAISARHRGVVVVRTADGGIFALTASTGKSRWKYREVLPSLTLKGMSTPVFYQDIVFVGLDNGRLLLMNLKNGRIVQEMKLGVSIGGSDLDRIVDVDGRMVVRGDFFYAAAYQGRMVAVDVKRGKLLWTVDASSHVGLDVDKDNVYIVTVDNHVIAFDRFSGRELWTNSELLKSGLSAPLRIGGLVVVGSERGDLYWLSRKSGKLLERTDIASSSLVAPRAAGRRNVAVLDRGGDLSVVTVAGVRKASR